MSAYYDRKITELEEAQAKLKGQQRELAHRTEYFDPEKPNTYCYGSDNVGLAPDFQYSELRASEIVQRFKELYELLGVSREHVPPETKLVKKKSKP
jgi:hypothetical protein